MKGVCTSSLSLNMGHLELGVFVGPGPDRTVLDHAPKKRNVLDRGSDRDWTGPDRGETSLAHTATAHDFWTFGPFFSIFCVIYFLMPINLQLKGPLRQ